MYLGTFVSRCVHQSLGIRILLHLSMTSSLMDRRVRGGVGTVWHTPRHSRCGSFTEFVLVTGLWILTGSCVSRMAEIDSNGHTPRV